MERILLQEAQTNHTGDLKSQLLIIRKHIATDQLYDLHQAALLVQDRHELVSVSPRNRLSTLVWYQGARSFRYSL